MRKILNLKPLIFLIVFNYIIIVFGSWILYNMEISIERFLRPLLPRLLTGLIQAMIGTLLILTWIFIWLKLYKYLFLREINKQAKN